MNYTQTFEEFSGSLGPMDLALYAGVGIIVWVLFQDQLKPAQKALTDLFNNVKSKIPENISVVVPDIPDSFPSFGKNSKDSNDVFFELVASWKQTRDLAEQTGCDKAVEAADQMFPYLSPTVCKAGGTNE